LVWYICW